MTQEMSVSHEKAKKEMRDAIEELASASNEWPLVSVPGPIVASVSNRKGPKPQINDSNGTVQIMTDQPIVAARIALKKTPQKGDKKQ